MPGLSGTVAMITGASSGIGAATAIALASEGAAVSLVARRRDRLDALAERLRDEGAGGAGGAVTVVEADITDQDQAIGAVDQTLSEHGRLDILINNAGVMLLGPVSGAPTSEWDRMVSINLQGLLYTTHAALPHLLTAAEGDPRRVADIVNISSVAGRVARAGSGVYNATKWGVNAFSEALRQEVTERHVRVAIIEPGATATELASHNRPEVLETMRGRFASVELMQAEDIADAITYVVTRPRRTAINEVLIRPTEQAG
jgi:NADP-dependent 3-hydroxy acid dehydrogenase YdfG